MKLFLCILAVFISFYNTDLYSESNSSHRLDDNLYWNGGGYVETGNSRIFPLKENDGGYIGWDVYLNSAYATQKGGLDKDRESGYVFYGALSPEIYLGQNLGDWNLFLLGAPLIGYKNERVVIEEENTLLDGELIAGISLRDDAIYLQMGRGFQRLDRYGFMMNSFMNFIQIGLNGSWNQFRTGLGLIGGNWNSDQDRLSPVNWNYERRNVAGVSWYGKISDELIHWNAFSYRMIRDSIQPESNRSFQSGEDFKYNGLEVKIDPKIWNISFELGGLAMEGYLNEFIPGIFSINDPKNSKSSNLFYGKINWNLEDYIWELNGLIITRDGWEPMNNRSRFMGGEGSILLNLHEFRNVERFESSKLDAVGSYLAKKWTYNHKVELITGIYFNQSNSYFGRGREGILNLGILHEKENFLWLSVAYANIDPQITEPVLVEEIREKAKSKDYIRFFISSGFRF